jgi:flagellar basal-body rod protein FlgC
MTDFTQALAASSSGMRAQARRLVHVSENIANADTPGYRRKIVPFQPETAKTTAGVALGPVQLDKTSGEKIFNPSHPLADESGHYTGSNVNLLLEIADAREAQRSYEANLKMFDQTRQMSSALMDLLRR